MRLRVGGGTMQERGLVETKDFFLEMTHKNPIPI